MDEVMTTSFDKFIAEFREKREKADKSNDHLIEYRYYSYDNITKLIEAAQIMKEALETAAKQVTWIEGMNQDIVLTYGFHIEKCKDALAKVEELLK